MKAKTVDICQIVNFVMSCGHESPYSTFLDNDFYVIIAKYYYSTL